MRSAHAGALTTASHASAHLVSVIVRALPGQGAAADEQVTSLGGHIQQHISLINAVVAEVPANAIPELNASQGVAQVTLNASVQLLGASYGLPSVPYNPVSDVNSMYNIEQMDGAHAYWNAGYTGQGVGVAVIDSGVTPVDGLTTPGKVVNGPDLREVAPRFRPGYLEAWLANPRRLVPFTAMPQNIVPHGTVQIPEWEPQPQESPTYNDLRYK